MAEKRGKAYEPTYINGFEYQLMSGMWMFRAINEPPEPIWFDTGIKTDDPEAANKLTEFKAAKERELRQEKTT